MTAVNEPSTRTVLPDGQGGQLRRVLGVPSLVLFGLVYMVPLTIFTTYGIVTQMSGGRVPLAYIVTLVALVFTARSYGLMAKAFPWLVLRTPTRSAASVRVSVSSPGGPSCWTISSCP
jgi:hypothetical protein